MKNHSKLFIAAAAALVLSSPAFAHDHDHGQGQEHGAMEHGHEGGCPHHQATETAVTQAMALLDQAKTQTGDQAKATIEKARQQLAEAQTHMAACQEMCKMKMGDEHGEHGGHAGMGGHAMHDAAPAGNDQAMEAKQVTDPVCGMTVDPKTATNKSVYAGKTYYFCSKEDKAKFDGDPEKYLKKQG
jgi:YHS domain-containing protein